MQNSIFVFCFASTIRDGRKSQHDQHNRLNCMLIPTRSVSTIATTKLLLECRLCSGDNSHTKVLGLDNEERVDLDLPLFRQLKAKVM